MQPPLEAMRPWVDPNPDQDSDPVEPDVEGYPDAPSKALVPEPDRTLADGREGQPAGWRLELNWGALGLLVVSVWALGRVLDHTPAHAGEALAWRWLRTVVDHPLRGVLALGLACMACVGPRAFLRRR